MRLSTTIVLALLIAVAWALGVIVFMRAVHAKPWEGMDKTDPMVGWYDSLYNKRGGHCCGWGDCHPVAYKRLEDGSFIAEAEPGHWIDVPSEAFIDRSAQLPGGPTSGVLCWSEYFDAKQLRRIQVYCFTEGYNG